METIKKSEFSFRDFLISKSDFYRKPVDKEQNTYDISIVPSGIIHEKDKVFQLNLEVEVTEKNDRFKAIVIIIGFFEFTEVLDENQLTNYFYTNAPAILFPYVRAYIASLTALSGMETVNLPPINMSAPEFRDQLIQNITKQ